MKTPRIANAIANIDDDLVIGANREKVMKKSSWLKWGSIAACFAIMLVAVAAIAPMLFKGNDPVPPIDNESFYEKGYFYKIDEGAFSTYVGGKVIANDKIGKKISDVSLTAGWKNAAGEWTSETERLRGEVYSINGISTDVAAALKFIDKGEAVTTTHYYVIMNPDADLTPVNDYIITPNTSNNPGEENAFEKEYSYGIKEGKFSAYIGGKVIVADKIGAKIEDVSVKAGWKNGSGEWLSTENLNAEVYAIDGISSDIAVALKFIDQGEVLTTTHYYVIMNPNADLTMVQEYIIEPISSNTSEGAAGEVNE